MPESRLVSFAQTFWRRLRARLLPVYVEQHTRLITPDPADLCHNPIFVIGAHRSGTTLLRRILDSHPRIACPPESQFMAHFFELVQHERSMVGLADLGFHEADALRMLRHSAVQFHELYRRSKHKPRWADKTPEYCLHLPGLHRLFGDVASYIFMFRHPLDVATSRWARLLNVVKPPGDEQLVDCCEIVRSSQAAQLDFLDQQRPDALIVHYEDLVAQPEPTLRQLCEYICEPWDDRLLKHYELPHDFGLEDPMVRVTRGFKPSHENWRQWTPRQLEVAMGILGPVMQRLGYTPDTVERRPVPLVTRRAA